MTDERQRFGLGDFSQYGPYAFGVLSLLMIWFTIVKPQLDRQQIDYAQHQILIDKIREMSINLMTSTAAIERTSIIQAELIKELRK